MFASPTINYFRDSSLPRHAVLVLKKRRVTRVLKEPHLALDWQRGKQEEKLGSKARPSTLAHLGRKQVINGWECWLR